MSTAAISQARDTLRARLRSEIAKIREQFSPEETSRNLRRYADTGAWGFGDRENEATSPAKIHDALDVLEAKIDELTELNASTIALALETFEPIPKQRAAVLERAAATWPWLVDYLDGVLPEIHPSTGAGGLLTWLLHDVRVEYFASTLEKEEDVAEAHTPWSPDVADNDVINWVAKAVDAERRGTGQKYRDGCDRIAEKLQRNRRPEFVVLDDNSACGRFLQGQHLAHLCAAAKAVERDRKVPAFKMSTMTQSHSAIQMLAAGPPRRAEGALPWQNAEIDRGMGGRIVLSWEGKLRSAQLHLLPDSGETPDGEVAKGILAELGDEGFRDYLVLHRLATAQGGTGVIRWSWDEHKERTHYAGKVANKNATDAELARDVRRRLGQLKRAEVWVEYERDGKTARKRVGPFGLIDIDAELLRDNGQTPMVASIRLNPELYRGARESVFTLIPEDLLSRPIDEVRIFTLASFPWRAGEAKGVAALRAKTLWEYAGIRDGKYTHQKRYGEARRALEKVLGRLSQHAGVTFTGGGDGPDAVYTLTAPPWLRDRLVHGVGPLLAAPATIAVPRTGAELAAMRKTRSLTARQVAEAVGVSHTAILRAEKRTNDPLPVGWLDGLAAAKWTLDRVQPA